MDESQNGGSAAGLSRGRRMLVLGICCLSLLIVGLDTTIVNVALPAIRSSLHASVSGLQWTIDAYTLVLASLLMLAGSTADRIGRKRIFRAATHTGWWICAGLGLLSLVLGLLTTTQWAENTARETAERFRESEEPPSRGAARTAPSSASSLLANAPSRHLIETVDCGGRDRDDALNALGARQASRSLHARRRSRCQLSATRRSSSPEAGIPRPSTAPA